MSSCEAFASQGQSGLWIDDTVPSPGRLDKLWIFFLKDSVVLLSIPVPDAVASEHKVHLFESALVGLWIQSPYDDYAEHVDCAEDV